MSKEESNEIAKAIREQTAYFKSITDTIKIILLVAGITIIAVYGFIFVGGLVSNYLNQGHETIEPVAQPEWKQNTMVSENMSKKIIVYENWCVGGLYHNGIWVTQNNGNLPYCENIYGEKIHT